MIRAALYLIGGSVLFTLSFNMAMDIGAWLPVLGSFFGGALMTLGVES